MTSFAMIAGMIPTALALGEGGEQSAPLGRAVIGGLLASTLATLVFLPAIYVIVGTERRGALGVARSRRPGQRRCTDDRGGRAA